jgi:hypothetical protein
MARTRTLEAMRDQARALADMTNTTFVTNAELDVLLNQAIAELWSLLTAVVPQRYMLTAAITMVAGTREYALPGDFMALVGVDWVRGDDRYPLEPFALNDRAVGPYAGGTSLDPWTPACRYDIRYGGLDGSGERLVFDRDPPAGSVEVLYVQAPQLLEADDDVFDGVAGWEDWAVLDVAIKMLAKEESDPSMYVAQQARLDQQIKGLAGKRDIGRARQIPRYSDGQGRGRTMRLR